MAQGEAEANRGSSFLEIAGDGAMAGLYGAATVALWFLAVDSWVREPLFTPSLVGSTILSGGVIPTDSEIELFAVAFYTALHSLLFIAFSIPYAWVLSLRAKRPEFPLIAISIFVPLELGFVVITRLALPGLAETVGHGFIVAGNALAAVSMALYLTWGQPHPRERT
jgi:hypothetical protein